MKNLSKKHINIIECIGILFFLLNQIFDIIVLAEASFFNLWIEIFMYFFFLLNIYILFVNHVPKEITYPNYFEIDLSRERTQQQREVITDAVFQEISLFCGYTWNVITALFWYIIIAFTHMFILWFGLYKLSSLHSFFEGILSNFIFQNEQNQWLLLQKSPQQEEKKQVDQPQKEQQADQPQKEQQQLQQADQSQQKQEQQQKQQQPQSQQQEQKQQQQKTSQSQLKQPKGKLKQIENPPKQPELEQIIQLPKIDKHKTISLPIQDENNERMQKEPHDPKDKKNNEQSNRQQYKTNQIVPELNVVQKNEFDIEKQEQEYEINVFEKFSEELKKLCYKLELTEKILLNFPQLIIQIINCSVQGKETTGIQIASIVFSFLNIIYNIILNVFKKNDELSDQIGQIADEISDILEPLPYIQMIEIIQVILYCFITASYKWVDYLDFQDQETHGKDLHDSVRAFIIIFPFAWLINGIIIIQRFNQDSLIDLKKRTYLIVPLFIKDAIIIQVCFDLLVFKAPSFEYGQSVMLGTGNMKVLLAIIFISQLIETVLFYFKFIENNSQNYELYGQAYVFAIIYIIIDIKVVSHWVNMAHYYDWTNLDYKISYHEKKQGLSCNHDVERTIRGQLVTFLFFFIGKYIVYLFLISNYPFEDDSQRKNAKETIIIFYVLAGFIYGVITVCYLGYRSNNKFCDNLRFVQKEENAVLSMHIIIQAIFAVVVGSELNY